MDHAQFKANHTAALYVSRDLDEQVQESFELHLMSCPVCVQDVEVWRAMRAGIRDRETLAVPLPAEDTWRLDTWRIAASLAVVAIGSGAAGWYGHSFAGPSLTDDAIAVFNLPPLTRGFEDCETLRLSDATELVALRVPNAATDGRLELTDEQGSPIAARDYSVSTQADGTWLLRIRTRPFEGELLRLQTRGSGGATEPVGCVVIPRGLAD